jgi:hypothetical protein
MKRNSSIRVRLARVVLVGFALWLLPAAVSRAQGIGSAVSPAFALDTRPGLDVPPAAPSPPLKLALHPAQPNPFTWRTSVHFDLPVGGRVRLEISDVAGRHVRTLVDGTLTPGAHVSEWDGRGDGGGLRAGIYFARLEAPGGTLRRKLVRLD